MAAFKVVIADQPAADHEVESAALEASGLRLEAVWLAGQDADRVGEQAADADALVMSWTPVTRLLIDQLRRCRVIARFGIGVDMIDLDAATERGILVCNTATYCLDEVSNHAMGLLLMLNRGLLQDIDAVRSGGWFRAAGTPPRRLDGQRLGLVGLGNIGKRVARKARGFGLDVVAYDPYLRREHAEVDGIALVDLDELLETADVVSVHPADKTRSGRTRRASGAEWGACRGQYRHRRGHGGRSAGTGGARCRCAIGGVHRPRVRPADSGCASRKVTLRGPRRRDFHDYQSRHVRHRCVHANRQPAAVCHPRRRPHRRAAGGTRRDDRRDRRTADAHAQSAFDHRLVDGAPAARFLQRIKHLVERPTLWLFR